MRFQAFNHKAKKAPTLYIRIQSTDITKSLINVLREDFDYDTDENWVDYLVVEKEIFHILQLLRVCYNADELLTYNPFGQDYSVFVYHRMRLRT